MSTEVPFKARQRAMWAAGDYHAFATSSIWDLGPMLVEACAISAGQRVLDVAAGTGNVAIRAAEAGATVVASDLTPENFDAGRREASAHGVHLEWVEADAQALPFGDAEFDVVTSAVGAIFAPDHRAVADELLRVCRPGGTIGLIALAPSNAMVALFELMTAHAREPVFGDESPLLWGDERHVRRLFGGRVESLSLERRCLDSSPLRDLEFFKTHHPVLVSIYDDLAGQPERIEALDRRLAESWSGWQSEPQELLLIVARKRSN
jgi:ubiquinone/menaquinone biosynthesis C-methylase UbiE